MFGTSHINNSKWRKKSRAWKTASLNVGKIESKPNGFRWILPLENRPNCDTGETEYSLVCFRLLNGATDMSAFQMLNRVYVCVGKTITISAINSIENKSRSSAKFDFHPQKISIFNFAKHLSCSTAWAFLRNTLFEKKWLQCIWIAQKDSDAIYSLCLSTGKNRYKKSTNKNIEDLLRNLHFSRAFIECLITAPHHTSASYSIQWVQFLLLQFNGRLQ